MSRRRTYGFSFSLSRAVGLAGLRGRIARETGIPTTVGGAERKIGRMVIRGGGWIIGLALLILLAAIIGPVRAAEIGPKSAPTHALTVCPAGWAHCITSPPQGEAACQLDAASERLARDLPAGSRIICDRVRR